MTNRSHHSFIPGTESHVLDVSSPTDFSFIPHEAAVLISIPEISAHTIAQLGGRPARVVYLSTTGVYGSAREVDETTAVDPSAPRTQFRVEAEAAVSAGPWSALILRPAAIYGPGRGVHISMAEGKWLIPGDGSGYVSRIHVEDLARISAAALLSPEIQGAYPVADEEPSTSLEITRFCSALLGRPMPGFVAAADVHHTRRSDRRVNGQAICRVLGIELLYPSYRFGIPDSLEK